MTSIYHNCAPLIHHPPVQGEIQLLIHHNLDTYIIYLYIIYHISYILPTISSPHSFYFLKLFYFIFSSIQYWGPHFSILPGLFFSDPVTGLMARAINLCFGIKHVIDHLKIIIISLECHPSHSHNTNNPTIKMLLSLSLSHSL